MRAKFITVNCKLKFPYRPLILECNRRRNEEYKGDENETILFFPAQILRFAQGLTRGGVVTLSPYGATAVKNIVALLGQGSTLVLLVVFSSPRHPFIAI